MPDPTSPLPEKVLDALARGNLLEAIKYLRDAKGLGLKQAKQAVDKLRAQMPPMHGGSPGEVPRSSGAMWWLAAAIVALVVV